MLLVPSRKLWRHHRKYGWILGDAVPAPSGWRFSAVTALDARYERLQPEEIAAKPTTELPKDLED